MKFFIKIISIPLGMLYYLFCQIRFFIILYYPKRTLRDQYVYGIGNLSMGGTGKTPVELEIARLFDGKVNLVTRGYKRGYKKDIKGFGDELMEKYSAFDMGDEAYLFASTFPRSYLIISSDKEKALVESNRPYHVTLLDDVFHKYKLNQDCRICIIDASDRGNRRLLPLGNHRHPLSDLYLADIVWINKINLVSTDDLNSLLKRIRIFKKKNAKIITSVYIVSGLVKNGVENYSLSILKGKKVFAFCGIGSPSSFFTHIENVEKIVLKKKAYGDHQVYGRMELNYIESIMEQYDFVITTEKDWVKLKDKVVGLYYLKANIVFEKAPNNSIRIK